MILVCYVFTTEGLSGADLTFSFTAINLKQVLFLPVSYWTLSIVGGITDMLEVTAVDCAPVPRCLIVASLTGCSF